MTNNGHKMTGISVGIGYGGFLMSTQPGFTAVMMLAIMPAAFFGGIAPDRVEWLGSNRWVTHRTWTHWVPLWILPIVLAYFYPLDLPVYAQEVLMAFLLGGVSHLIVDLPNPTGIPFLTPYHRLSLNWWKSGQLEWLLIPLFLLAAFYPWLVHYGVVNNALNLDFLKTFWHRWIP